MKCKSVCDDELKRIVNGEIREVTADQISSMILPEMDLLLKMSSEDSFPPQQDRYLQSFAYAFRVWEWDMWSPTELYRVITQLNKMYKELEMLTE
mgnify:FL=1